MAHSNIRRFVYQARHKYLTLNTVVMVIAFVIAASWVWGSLGVMQRNYTLQRELDSQEQQLELIQLQTTNDRLQQSYYKSNEYQELAARQELGLALPGEKVLVLPPNTPAAVAADTTSGTSKVAVTQDSNLEQWVNFLFGGYSRQANS